ncbi:unnamed protein product [Aphanomyces euteiches]
MGISCILPLSQPYRGQIEMVFSFNTHVSDEIDDEGATIAAIETHHQHTLPTDFRSAAAVQWEKIVGTNSTITMKVCHLHPHTDLDRLLLVDRARGRPLCVLPPH